MILKAGQRWKCFNPSCLMEIISIDPKSNDGVSGIILQSNDSNYPVGKIVNWWKLPYQDNVCTNVWWEYLCGQDRPI